MTGRNLKVSRQSRCFQAGVFLSTGSYNIYIGNLGQATESNTIRIGNSTDHNTAYLAGVRGVSVTGPEYVVIDANGKLGSTASAGGGYWTGSGNDIYNNNSGNVGIGETSPAQKLDVGGHVEINSRLYIGSSLFLHNTGSDNTFVAPVTVGDGAYTGAGTVVREDVPPGALAVSSGPQRNLEGWVTRKRPGTAAAQAAEQAAKAEQEDP